VFWRRKGGIEPTNEKNTENGSCAYDPYQTLAGDVKKREEQNAAGKGKVPGIENSEKQKVARGTSLRTRPNVPSSKGRRAGTNKCLAKDTEKGP